MQAATDDMIWQFALQFGATIVSKDEDFARRLIQGVGPPIIWLRLPNCNKRELIAAFERVHRDLMKALERGDDLIEIV